jgi:hypothetical protein
MDSEEDEGSVVKTSPDEVYAVYDKMNKKYREAMTVINEPEPSRSINKRVLARFRFPTRVTFPLINDTSNCRHS